MNNSTTIVYIMGRGHSGTTMLDAVLGNHPAIESTGELISGLSRFEKEQCSCGLNTLECSFWIQVVNNYKKLSPSLSFEEFCRQSIRQANIGYLYHTLFKSKDLGPLLQSNDTIMQAISMINNKKIIVDSTKEPTRGLLLNKYTTNSYIIHLVRRPERVVSSYYFRIQKGLPLKFLRKEYYPKGLMVYLGLMVVGISWSAGNLLAELSKLFAPKKCITIRYESFLAHPDKEIARIGKLLQLDLSDLATSINNQRPFEVGHNIGGNEFRHEKTFVVAKDVQSRRSMPWIYTFSVKLINLPMLLFYGYNPFTDR